MADFILDKHLKNAISFATYILVPIFKMRFNEHLRRFNKKKTH